MRSKKVGHAEQCVRLYEEWDKKWKPGRHAEIPGSDTR